MNNLLEILDKNIFEYTLFQNGQVIIFKNYY